MATTLLSPPSLSFYFQRLLINPLKLRSVTKNHRTENFGQKNLLQRALFLSYFCSNLALKHGIYRGGTTHSVTLPIWVKLSGLDFKYWSPKELSKIGVLIGMSTDFCEC
ncbi:hypothetical protein HAX54_033942 [Datura stramonium]|uniref:Uncharacterized protein n=1 Tax=Datura stramonium TaxID=4076 RepID=A0ABS8Y8L5_DATST|nr:hypothetical protein [Datura stramonium]